MTKLELLSLVEQVYATYNQQLPHNAEQEEAIYRAWYELLHDLELEEAKRAFLGIAVWAEFMPRPGTIRRATINARTKITQFDEPLVAWGKWITLSKEVNSGMPPSIPVSDALKLTVQKIGEPAYGMHTNSDREAFCKTYEAVVAELDAERYAVPPVPPSKNSKDN
jgi:hypothetical protein